LEVGFVHLLALMSAYSGVELDRMDKKGPISVLLVDDNLTFLRIATRFLDAYDDVVVVGTVSEGETALAQAQALQPDVVLVDTAMSSLQGGLKFIPQLREVLPRVGIIALTLIGTDGYRQAALEAGADDFVPKAAMGADLLSAIRRVKQTAQLWKQAVRPVDA
jgi:two-component system response regulator NreC